MIRKSRLSHCLAGALTLTVGLAIGVAPATAQDQPFALVNVVDLFDLFSLDSPDQAFDPNTSEPSNWLAYRAAPRVGTNPSVVATDGERAWIGGFYNGANYNRFITTGCAGDPMTLCDNQASWYASVGVAEVRNIGLASGTNLDFTRYPIIQEETSPGVFEDRFVVGPGIRNTDWISGIDYDPFTQKLYVSYDAILPPFSTIMPNAGLDWRFYETFITKVDADPDSPTYATIEDFRENPVPSLDPFNPTEVRAFAGVSIDSLDSNFLAYPKQGTGFVTLFDANDFSAPTIDIFVTDTDSLMCNSTAFRGNDFHPETGEWISRVLNGIQTVERDTSSQVAPYQTFPRFIREPSDMGNGTADTMAAGDDVQLVAVGALAAPSQDIIGVGPNGVLDTVPAGDDLLSLNGAIRTERILGNPDGNCPNDPDGLPAGANPQGQGLAIIPSSNLEEAAEDLLLANNRPVSGANQLTDIRFFNLNGDEVADLPIPCAPIPGANTGIGIYDFDYDPISGTLVVVEFERRLLFVYKAQLTGENPVPKYDFTRNGTLDLADFAGFQSCFTGSEGVIGGPSTLNCLRVNTDSDCDVDFVDYLIVQAGWDAFFAGP